MKARIALLIWASLAIATGPVLAQNQTPKPPRSGPKPAGRPPAPVNTTPVNPAPAAPAEPAGPETLPPLTPVELAPEAFKVNSIGLTMHLPAGAQVETTGAAELQATRVIGKDQSWVINIKTVATKSQRTAPQVAAEVRDQLLALSAPMDKTRGQPLKNGRTRARVLRDVSPLVITTAKPEESRPASTFYVSIPRGEKESPLIRGYTLFEVAPGRYISFDLAVPERNFAAARSAFETCVGTTRFTHAAAAAAARGAAVETGMTLLNKLTAADLDAACATMKDQWFRLAKPLAGGLEQELAYRRVRAWKGKRGELDTGRDTKHWSVQDYQEGYLVRIDARMLQEGKVIDSVGTYFMSTDRREEGWLLQMVVRDPSARKPSTWREIGGRSGASMSISTDGSGESKQAQPTVPDQGYLNQVEAFLLPQLLIHAGSTPGDYGFYAYQSSSANASVSLRRDVLEAGPGASCTISTRLNEDSEPQTSVFSESGALVKTTLANGNTWTPTTLGRLAEIWKAKNLPMD